jgi:hypothetical protein
MFDGDHDEIRYTHPFSGGWFYSLVVCSCYASVSRRFPTEELVALTVFNIGFSMASVKLGSATVWHPLHLLNSLRATPSWPGRLGLSALAWIPLAIYNNVLSCMPQFLQ